MIPEGSTIRATVRQVNDAWADVEVAQGGCGRCHEKGGCGGQHLTQMFCSGPRHYQVKNTLGAQPGDEVIVALSAGNVRRSANMAYGLPLLTLFVGAVLGAQLGQDPGAMLGAALGLVVGFVLLAKKMRQRTGNFLEHPYIVSRSTRKQEE